jgi:hypothetical protein
VGEDSGLLKMLDLDQEGEDVSNAAGPVARKWVLRPLIASAAPEDLLPYADAYGPLFHGERTLVAVPFAFLVR